MRIFGKNVVLEYLKNNKKISKIYLSDKFADELILKQIEDKNITIERMEKRLLNRMESGMHQGIIAEVEEYAYADIDEMINDESLVIMLDHLEDPHNLGAIVRTAAAAGLDGIIIPKDRSTEVNSTVIKVSTGATEKVKIAMVTNLVNTINYLKKQGFWFVGTDMDGTDYTKIDYKGKICLVIGNEGTGLTRLVKESCDFIASIPIKNVESLNASVSAAIVTYEAIKCRNV